MAAFEVMAEVENVRFARKEKKGETVLNHRTKNRKPLSGHSKLYITIILPWIMVAIGTQAMTVSVVSSRAYTCPFCQTWRDASQTERASNMNRTAVASRSRFFSDGGMEVGGWW